MTGENLAALLQKFKKYRSKGILVDSNLLPLFLAGLALPDSFTTFKPVANQPFTAEDFELLCRIIREFKTVVTTPHILTEVSNHSDKLKGEDRHRFCNLLSSLVVRWEEQCPASAKLCRHDAFIQFGLTDTAIEDVARGNFLVITVDKELARHLVKRKVDVINYHNIRPLRRS